MDATGYSETSVYVQQATWRHITAVKSSHLICNCTWISHQCLPTSS